MQIFWYLFIYILLNLMHLPVPKQEMRITVTSVSGSYIKAGQIGHKLG